MCVRDRAPEVNGRKAKARTHLDRQRRTAEAGAAYSAGGYGAQLSRKAARGGCRHLRQPADLRDNLLALKALEQEFAGKVKCVFIDPPYNTGSAFTHYDDGLEHSIWLSLMRDRLEIIRRLLSDDGSLWITIDDNEAHYLKVLCDEVFGRANFVANIVWQSKDTPGNNASTIAQTHNMVLVFKKTEVWKPYLVPRSDKQIANYKNPDNDSRGPSWHAVDTSGVSGPRLLRIDERSRETSAAAKRQFMAATSRRNQEAPKRETHLLGQRWERRIPG